MRQDTNNEVDRPKERRLWPPRRVFVTLASLVAAVVLVRFDVLQMMIGPVVDHAVENIISLILCFSGLMSLLVWFLRESDHTRQLKWNVVGGIVLGIVTLVAVLRIERVSGDLVPEFNWRWAPAGDRLLKQHDVNESMATSPWHATENDFPGFLGPAGNCSLERPVLDADWMTSPPRLMWKQPIGAGWSGFATCGDHAVTLEQRGDEEVIACYDMLSGATQWIVAVPVRHETILGGVGPRSTPTISDGVVFATGATGWLHAIDGASGKVLWRKNIVDDLGIDQKQHAICVAWGRAGSPLVTNELVIVPAGGPLRKPTTEEPEYVSVVAYERDTGKQRWIAGDEQISFATPILASFGGLEQVVSVNESHVAAYDLDDGAQLWEVEWPGHSNSDASCSQAVPLNGQKFFISKGYGVGAAVFRIQVPPSDPSLPQTWDVEPVWQAATLLKTKFTNVVVHEGYAYGLSDGILECVNVSDGTRAWKRGRYGQGQVLRVGALLLVQAESGEVCLVRISPEAHREVARFDAIMGQTWNNPCLSGNRLLVRNAEEAACYEVPVRRVPSEEVVEEKR